MSPLTRSKRFNLDNNSEGPDPNKRLKCLQQSQESFFLSKECMERYHSRFLHGEIVAGKLLDLEFFNKEKFPFGEWFHDMKWVSFVSMKERYYPELVKHFYANLSHVVVDNDVKISSFVKGQEIELNLKCLNKIVGVPNSGVRLYDHDYKWSDLDNGGVRISRLDALRVILDDNELTEVSFKVNACHFKLDMRLLHHMIVHLILPRKRNLSFVSDMDLFVMWHVVKGKGLNLPFLLLLHMIACSEKKNLCLPYGMLLTLIFKHFNVSLENEESTELKGLDVYNECTLRKMGYVKSGSGWSLKKDKGIVKPSLEVQFEETMNVGKTEDSLTVPEPNTVSVPNPVSEEMVPNFTELARELSVAESILLLVKEMKEVIRNMLMAPRLDDLRVKLRRLGSLIGELRSKSKERAITDIFLLLEDIMGDMRIMRARMSTFRDKIAELRSKLIKFLHLNQDLSETLKERIQMMILETMDSGRSNEDTIGSFESLRSQIQDMWDRLSSYTALH